MKRSRFILTLTLWLFIWHNLRSQEVLQDHYIMDPKASDYYSNTLLSSHPLDNFYLLKPTASVGGARAFAIIGFVLPVPLITLTTMAGLSDDFTSGTILGASALIIGGIGIPLVASSGSRLRRENGTKGSLGLIITGWALYGVAMANGVVAVGLSASEIVVPVEVGVSIAILGSAASIIHALETNKAANAALVNSSARVLPLFTIDKIWSGEKYSNFGLVFKF